MAFVQVLWGKTPHPFCGDASCNNPGEGLNSNRNNKISTCLGANIALQSLQIDSALFRAVGLESLDRAGKEYRENNQTQL
jgi:hypothetical protein